MSHTTVTNTDRTAALANWERALRLAKTEQDRAECLSVIRNLQRMAGVK